MQLGADLIARLRSAEHLVVFTGAGVSAESGLPTFRDSLTGLWRNFDPQALATPEAFERDPALVWGWYESRRAAVVAAEPNAGHRAIAALQRRVEHLTLITQNVDDLHERAGSDPVLHLHGRIGQPYCSACRCEYRQPPPADPVSPLPRLPSFAPARASKGSPEEPGVRAVAPPRCHLCGGRVRPGVVWFGEELPAAAWQQSVEAARSCDAFLSVGTSSVVEPAAGLTRAAIACGAATIQINIAATGLDEHVTLNLRGPSASLLPELVATVWPRLGGPLGGP